MQHGKKPYIKADEAAKDFGIGTRAWYALIHSGQIRAIRLGRKLLVPRASFLSWYNSAGQVSEQQ